MPVLGAPNVVAPNFISPVVEEDVAGVVVAAPVLNRLLPNVFEEPNEIGPDEDDEDDEDKLPDGIPNLIPEA
jgi:hypothetical protein